MKIGISANDKKKTPYDSSVRAKNTFNEIKTEAIIINLFSLPVLLKFIPNKISINGYAKTRISWLTKK